MNESTENLDHESATIIRIRRHLPTVWLIPLVAMLIGIWLAFNAYVAKGPTFTITFLNADGLEAGRTKIKCKDVEVGKVKSLKLSHDRSKVCSTMAPPMEYPNRTISRAPASTAYRRAASRSRHSESPRLYLPSVLEGAPMSLR